MQEPRPLVRLSLEPANALIRFPDAKSSVRLSRRPHQAHPHRHIDASGLLLANKRGLILASASGGMAPGATRALGDAPGRPARGDERSTSLRGLVFNRIEARLADADDFRAATATLASAGCGFWRRSQSSGAQASASRPLSATRFSNFKEGPLGFFCPCSHFCTVDGLVLRYAANTA